MKDYLKTLRGLSYGVFRFPFGQVFVCGDECALKYICFDREAAEKEYIVGSFSTARTTPVSMAVRFLEEYMKGRKAPMPELDLSPFTVKERAVYRALLKIAAGRTISYGGLAEKAGVPFAARFVGNAMAKNIFPVLIPCHRVVKNDGSPGNYTSGTDIKEFLLRHEGAPAVSLQK